VSVVARTYHGAASASGQLLVLERTQRVVSGEWVTIMSPGQPPRRGQVIDASERATVIHVQQDLIGFSPSAADIVLTGDVARTVVGRDLLGRMFTGGGTPADDLPPPIGEAMRPVTGAAINPARRARPMDLIETGISAIDGLTTLVRGQKLPIFAGPGLPALDLAARIVAWARAPGNEEYAVIFVGMGITARESAAFLASIGDAVHSERMILYINHASDPPVERLLAPRVALTQAEYLAFECGMQVLVVMADITHYCEALRELGASRDEIPGRRGYPGYMYTDLASLFERAGLIDGCAGSITQIPVVTLPDDDITHPIPDLTGYITEGQIVLARDLHSRGVSPPVDVLPSLSRLMSAGIGSGSTRADHREVSDQLYALYARGREALTMAAVVGMAGLTDADRRAAEFSEQFERELVTQRERRTIGETIEIGWRLLEAMTREELSRITQATWAARAAVAVRADAGESR
jgi:V/A-type H+-transporting ATPase subunit B